jgi:Reverse transcriptase (RNA-dependent DNA polymerase)
LDQEKAYDKIDHVYLWQTLQKFGVPEEFIKTVQVLYQTAETQIMVNGHLSSPWQITRGVHQGDPLSCLLLDLAIEPLAASLRNSELKGFKIPGRKVNLRTSLLMIQPPS